MFNWIIARSIVPHVVIVLFALFVTASAGWYITRNNLVLERTERANDKLTYEKAQADATAKALKEKQEKEAEYAAIKAKQDSSYLKLLNEYRSAVVRYKTAQRQARRSNLPSTPGSSSVDVRPGDDSLVSVPFSDLEICAVNTAKAQVAHEWALEINKTK